MADDRAEAQAALADWRAAFDVALAQVRAEPDDGHSNGPARGRSETRKAIEAGEVAFWRAWEAAQKARLQSRPV